MSIINGDLCNLRKSCRSEKLSTKAVNLKGDFSGGGGMSECSEARSMVSLLLSACSFADYIINKGGYLVF